MICRISLSIIRSEETSHSVVSRQSLQQLFVVVVLLMVIVEAIEKGQSTLAPTHIRVAIPSMLIVELGARVPLCVFLLFFSHLVGEARCVVDCAFDAL